MRYLYIRIIFLCNTIEMLNIIWREKERERERKKERGGERERERERERRRERERERERIKDYLIASYIKLV